jgi:hypothetical protein
MGSFANSERTQVAQTTTASSPSVEPRFDWPSDPVASDAAENSPVTGWGALEEPEEKRRRWPLVFLLLALLLLVGWLVEQSLQPSAVLSLGIATDGLLAPPQNRVFSGQALGPEHLMVSNSGTERACWWISAEGDNPSLARLITIRIADAGDRTLYAGPIPGSAPAILFGSACANPPIGTPSGTEAALAPGATATATITGTVGDLPPALNGQILTITWSSVGAPAGQ